MYSLQFWYYILHVNFMLVHIRSRLLQFFALTLHLWGYIQVLFSEFWEKYLFNVSQKFVFVSHQRFLPLTFSTITIYLQSVFSMYFLSRFLSIKSNRWNVKCLLLQVPHNFLTQLRSDGTLSYPNVFGALDFFHRQTRQGLSTFLQSDFWMDVWSHMNTYWYWNAVYTFSLLNFVWSLKWERGRKREH